MKDNITPIADEHSALYSLFLTPEKFKGDVPNGVHKEIAYALQLGFDKLLGDILTLVELLGLPEKQEQAIKSQIKKTYFERYSATADHLITVPLALMQVLTPDQDNSLTIYTPNQNESITGSKVILD